MPLRVVPISIPPRTHLADADWARFAENLLGFAVALCGSRHEAEDLVQQTIATLLAKRPACADHRGLARITLTRLYLSRRRAHRRLLERLRSVACRRARKVEESDRVEVRDEAMMAKEAIDSLPARQRAALLLRVVEGLSYEAIAEALECEVGAVRANLHLARMKVRSRLEGGA